MYLGEVGLARLSEIFKAKLDGLMIWETTPKAASVSFCPAPNCPLEVEQFFSCTEVLPAGAKSEQNPSTVTPVTGASVVHGSETVTQPFGMDAYGGSYVFHTGKLKLTHWAVSPEASPVDISEHPVDTSAPGFIDTWGRTVTASQDGKTLTVSGNAAGGLIVYRLASPEEYPLVQNPMFAPAHPDRLGDVEADTVTASFGTVQVMYGSPAGRPATDAEIDALYEEGTLLPTGQAQIATQAYVQQAVAAGVANLVNSAPAALDTLKELSDAIGGDASFAATVAGQIGTKLSTSSSGYVKNASMSGVNLVLTKGDNSTETVALMPDAATDAEIDALFE